MRPASRGGFARPISRRRSALTRCSSRCCWPTTRRAWCKTWRRWPRSCMRPAGSCTSTAPRRSAECLSTSMRWAPISRAFPPTSFTGPRGPGRCSCGGGSGPCGSSRSCMAAVRNAACGVARSTCRGSWGWPRRPGWRSRGWPRKLRGCGGCGIGCGRSCRPASTGSSSTVRRSIVPAPTARPFAWSTISTCTCPVSMVRRCWRRSRRRDWPSRRAAPARRKTRGPATCSWRSAATRNRPGRVSDSDSPGSRPKRRSTARRNSWRRA